MQLFHTSCLGEKCRPDRKNGDIVSAGQCGENAYYALYSNGKVLVKGTGAMYNYDLEFNRSPFYRNDAVRSVVVSEGITTVGEDAFERCLNLESVSLPTSLTSIGSGAFMPADEYPSAAGKLNSITIAILAVVEPIAFCNS